MGVRRIQDIDAKNNHLKASLLVSTEEYSNFLSSCQSTTPEFALDRTGRPKKVAIVAFRACGISEHPCVLQRRSSTKSNPWEWQNFVVAEFPVPLTVKNNHGSWVSSLCTCTLQAFLLLCETGEISLPFVTSSSRKCLVVCLRSTTHAKIAETLRINLHKKPLHSLQSCCSQ